MSGSSLSLNQEPAPTRSTLGRQASFQERSSSKPQVSIPASRYASAPASCYASVPAAVLSRRCRRAPTPSPPTPSAAPSP